MPNDFDRPRPAVVLAVLAACASEPSTDGDGSTAGASTNADASGGSSGSATASTSTGTASPSSTTADPSTTTDASTTEGGSESGRPARLPSEVLDLAAWKLTLPIGDPRDADAPREVLQPELATFTIDPWFQLAPTSDAVLFRAHAGGVTTDNSGYPRSELREMTSGGAEEAAWSTSEGTHTMTIVQAITALPEVKPHVVAGQIHDAEDDVVMIRLEGEHLFVEGGGEELGDLEPAYALGTEFTVVLAAHDGMIEIYYEDLAAPAVAVARDVDGCYFKAGAYTQSNEEQGDAPDAYGEVVISELAVEHTVSP